MSQILSITEIQELLPHRYPFLMIDRIEIGDEPNEIRAIKNVTTNEVHFSGHFPGNPIMPGVLQVESVLQAGIIAFKKQAAKPVNSYLIIKEVKRVRFKSPIIPGDQVIIEARIENVTDEGCEIKATCKVKGVLKSQSHIIIGTLNKDDLIPKSFTTDFSKEGYDTSTDPVYNVNDISSFIPHRFPFQFIDNVIYSNEDNIVGEKLVSANEPFAISYTPDSPFMPNIMILETMAQLGCVHLLSKEEHRGKIGMFLSIENAVIHRPGVPGDKLTFDVGFLFFKGPMGKAEGTVYCGEEVVSTMTIAFALVDPGV
ncbi:MAG: 3-hydroxyacyl-ACP dehydratase FabZ [Lentisphaeraceae bacterium]|nr:3-hydroxyacyl-ACP dehydratase FabZ [Lentisphaeraceae bacterium]